MMEAINLSDYDRFLIVGLTESNNRLAAALEGQRQRVSEESILTCKQAAVFLGRDSSTISRMLADGRLHKVYEGGLSGIRKSELEQYKR